MECFRIYMMQNDSDSVAIVKFYTIENIYYGNKYRLIYFTCMVMQNNILS